MKDRKTKIFLGSFCLMLGLSAFLRAEDWRIIGEMPVPVSGAQAVIHGNRIYVIGGYSDSLESAVNLVQIFDPKTGLWEKRESFVSGRYGFVADVYENSVIIAGGITNMEKNTARVGIWDLNNPMQTLSQDDSFNRVYATGLIVNNQLFIFGGYPPVAEILNASAPYVIIYDLTADGLMFSAQGPFPGNLPYHQMTAKHGKYVYIFGGVYFSISNRIYQFDLHTHNIDRLPVNLLDARAGGAAVATPDGRLFLIGGYNEIFPAMDSVEIFQIEGQNNINIIGNSMHYARREPAAILYNNTIYVFGGKDARGRCVSAVEIMEFQREVNIVQQESRVPQTFKLDNNFPNPFNSQTAISFSLPFSSHVKLSIYANDGRQIKTLNNSPLPAGSHRFTWDGTNDDLQPAASGVYYYRLQCDTFQDTKKMILIR